VPFKELARIDKLVHEPARLAILNALAACHVAEFLFLQELTGLTKGNLSCHLSKLEKANLVSIDKHFVRKKFLKPPCESRRRAGLPSRIIGKIWTESGRKSKT